ncbi:MAG: CoA transferase [Chloroflexota bacterium]|nr:MAG: CoA transferase [Chloroflexota bacterium]
MERALAGIRILDLGRVLAGSFGSMHLADLGAEVIKIEPREGDDVRRIGGDHYRDESVYFMSLNRNKKGIVVDLKHPKGKEVFYDLVRVSDVVMDNFRPGVVERLAVDYETLSAINPRIICCSVSAYGHTGPYTDRPGYDMAIQALSGGMSITGEPGGPPVRMGFPIADLAGSIYGTMGVMAALLQRQRTGRGQKVDIAMLDTQIALLMYFAGCYFQLGEIPQRMGAGHPKTYPYAAYRTKDNEYIVVAIYGGQFWPKFCRALSIEYLIDDPRFDLNEKRSRNRAELAPIIQAIMTEKTLDEWVQLLNELDVPAAPVNTVDKALANPQVLARDMVITVDHPKVGPTRFAGNPIKMSDSPEVFEPAPVLGQHTAEILRGILGYTDEKIASLATEGATMEWGRALSS